MNYDAILIHPPSIYDFREKVLFPGPIGYTVSESTDQFIIPPVGMLSIADYLDRNGYKVIVDNIGERMVTVEGFNVEEHIKSLSAKVFAIGLHWCVHSQGATELARLCKKLHPEAMVILGGLPSTVFSTEIIQKYDFVDAVIRGEAEKPFLELMKVLEQNDKPEKVPNLTFRNSEGKVSVNPMMPPSETLDEYEYTRLDLIEPKKIIYRNDRGGSWFIPVCRGCSYNCATCGGSRYSYKTYLAREKPAFRSPEKIAEDMEKLANQGITSIFLFQDPRMGGKDYWTKLFTALRSRKLSSAHISMELFGPADEEYIRQMANTGIPIVLSISPESCCDSVRKTHGRKYDNEELFNTLKLCKKYGIPIGVFSMIALGDDTPKTIKDTWKIWEQICVINQEYKGETPIHHAFGPMILLDPGSLAFDYPANYGYRLRFNNLEEYVNGMSLLSWHQWISYETKYLNKDSIAKLIIDSIEYSINLREKFGLFSEHDASSRRLRSVTINKMTIDVVNQVMGIEDEDERLETLSSFKKELDEALSKMVPVADEI
jgi:B12-binding domain/radical SAM domain protein